ncbi:MAG TPA: RDD family protein [Vicinamibacteria bacterium]|nr:RDD family protein [Vicinamibacteria bacterium]
MPRLVVNPTSSARREISLGRSTLLSIGRDPSNDLVLPDALVSRRHAVIECRGTQFYFRDCNSSNGSLVNGDRVSERPLRDGDLVSIGTARILFRDDDHEEASAKVVQHPSAPKLHCASCGADYRKGDQFCRQCGHALAPVGPPRAVCTACGSSVPLPARFCNACGQPLAGGAGGSGLDLPTVPPPPAGPAPVIPEEPGRARGAEEAEEIEVVDPEPGSGSPSSDGSPAASMEPLSTGTGSRPEPRPEPPVAKPSSLAPAPSPPPRVPTGSRGGGAVASAVVAARPAPARAEPSRALPLQTPVPQVRAVPVPRSRPPVVERAGFGVRLVAGLLDALIVAAVQIVLFVPVFYYWWAHELPATPSDVSFLPILLSFGLVPVVVALGGVYYVYFWGVRGTTPGKRLLGLVVQAEDGTEPIGVSRATIRALGYLVSGLLLGVGFLMIAFGGNGLHDRMAGTRVVRREEDAS